MAFVQKTALEHARPTPDRIDDSLRVPVVLVLDNIRSGNNVGSILRTADGLGLQEVVMAGYTPIPPHREILKTSLGAEDAVPWCKVEAEAEMLTRFRESGYLIAALEQTSDSIELVRLNEELRMKSYTGLVIVLGNEVRGVRPEILSLVDEVVEIQQYGTKQSFNVSVATAMVAWEVCKFFRG